jgi:hypothetical protein
VFIPNQQPATGLITPTDELTILMKEIPSTYFWGLVVYDY